MPRSEYCFKYSSVDHAKEVIERILLSNKFFEFNYRSENVWKRYNNCSKATVSHYLKIQYDSQNVNLSAWIGRDDCMEEISLNCPVGIASQKKLKNVIDEIACSV